jgi:hypothetical protein
MPRGRKQREPFGRIRKLPSGRHQAGYIGPDLALHRPASTFETLLDARAWLADERRLIDAGTLTAPAVRSRTAPATIRYQHVAEDRDAEIARRLSAMAEAQRPGA